jgi:hypothetical protein
MLTVAAVALCIAMPAQAAPADRVEEATYYGGSHLRFADGDLWIDGCIHVDGECVSSSAEFSPRRGERFINIEIVDDSGADVGATLVQSRRGNDLERSFCGATQKPIRVAPKKHIEIFLAYHGCGSGDPAPPTHGVVTATFSK